MSRGAYEGAWFAQAVADVRVLPPGTYVARARIRSGHDTVGELRRWFAVTRPPVTSAATAGDRVSVMAEGRIGRAPMSARSVGAVRPFALEHVLAPQVLGGFLDGLAARPMPLRRLSARCSSGARRRGWRVCR
jgi:hypothetical protein